MFCHDEQFALEFSCLVIKAVWKKKKKSNIVWGHY